MAAATLGKATYYITFRLGDELFAIPVAQVREVLDMSVITRVPRAPRYMRGVVNVRGSAIPVVDLRVKFGLSAVADSVNTRIVVLELSLDGEAVVVGGIADSVHEVIELEPSQIEEPPRMAMRWRAELVQGMGRRGDEFVIILDIDKVFTWDDVAQIGPLSAPTSDLADDENSGAALTQASSAHAWASSAASRPSDDLAVFSTKGRPQT